MLVTDRRGDRCLQSAWVHGACRAYVRRVARQPSERSIGRPSAGTSSTFRRSSRRLRAEAPSAGISADTVKRALTDLEPSPSVIERDQTQAEVVLSVDEYLSPAADAPVDPHRAGRMQPNTRRCSIGCTTSTACSPRFIVAIWGLESNFGRFSGVRPTIQALATLAWEGRRGPFFRGELMDALAIVDRKHIAPRAVEGLVGGCDGADAVHALELSAMGRRLRRGWRSRHLALARPMCSPRSPTTSSQHGWSSERDLGPRGDVCRRPSITDIREKAGMRVEGCRAEREMTTAPAAASVARSLGVQHGRRKALPRVEDRRVAHLHRETRLPRLRQLRRAARLQLRAFVRARRRACSATGSAERDRSPARPRHVRSPQYECTRVVQALRGARCVVARCSPPWR